jgi:glycosyltransferase involved in cell wall biosynthesis
LKALFIHQNFPGQFRHLVGHLARQGGHQLVCIGQRDGVPLPNTTYVRYRPKRAPGPATHPYLIGMESAVLAGQAVLETLLQLRQQGFVPDVVIAHPGWGETLYVREAYPAARLIHFCEFYYHTEGADVGFDPAFPLTLDQRARLRTRNALHLLNLENCDVAVSPTHWQKSVHPLAYQPRIEVIHEGVDTSAARPDPLATFELPDGRVLRAGDPVVTYVARNLEPYRGFPQFMQALAQLQAQRPDVQALIIGADGVSYGNPPADAPNWREKLLREWPLDASRTHFLGTLPHARYLQALQVSAAHVYLTVPFVLSWSLLEALASGCLVIASDTAPVREVIQHGRQGLLVDFFDVAALTQHLLAAVDQPAAFTALRQAGPAHVAARYSVDAGCAQWLALLQRVTQDFRFQR